MVQGLPSVAAGADRRVREGADGDDVGQHVGGTGADETTDHTLPLTCDLSIVFFHDFPFLYYIRKYLCNLYVLFSPFSYLFYPRSSHGEIFFFSL
jgi:hypothetical protein